MRTLRRARLAGLVLTATALAACTAAPGSGSDAPAASRSASALPAARPPTMPASVEGPLKVTKVVDGDTIWVRRGAERVKLRLIGIDSPETVDPGEPIECFGPESSKRAADLLADTQVYLEKDPSQADTDRYGRELVYVWTSDGTLVNLTMIEDGFAQEKLYAAPYAYRDEFLAAQARAKAARAGLWGVDGCAS